MLHAVRHLPPGGVLTVEEISGSEADKELRIGAVDVHRARHAAHAAVVRQIVELHGGRVFIESEGGSGATFIVEFPLVVVE